MPCPYFIPSAPSDWLGSYPRLPLGKAWEGECAVGPTGFHPQGALLFEVCNTGQGRARCPHFPKDSPRDAVRFHVLTDTPSRLVIRYVFENQCWPGDHGVLTFLVEPGAFENCPEDRRLAAQSYAFAQSYLTRRAETNPA